MSTIGGPGGIGGPKGPGATDDADLSQDVAEVDAGSIKAHETAGGDAVARAHGAEAAGALDALAADIAAGRLTPREAIDRLVEATAGPDLGAAERAELRELLTDLISNDPHLGNLAGRI